MGVRYGKYLEKLAAYKEILEDIENEKRAELAKKEANYWFSLSGHEFEEEMAKLLRARFGDASVIKTKGSGDGGIDLIPQ